MDLVDSDIRTYFKDLEIENYVPKIAELPFGLHVNCPNNYHLTYLDENNRGLFNLTYDDVKQNAAAWLVERVHPQDLARAIAICDHYQSNLDQYRSISFVQRVLHWDGKIRTLFTTAKLTEIGLVNFSQVINDIQFAGRSVDDILNETDFIRKNMHKFLRLTTREIEVLEHIGKGLTWKLIATQFNVTSETVKTYKKRIYKKLEIHQFHELYYYAKAFDFIAYG